jgi:hypothetical protein
MDLRSVNSKTGDITSNSNAAVDITRSSADVCCVNKIKNIREGLIIPASDIARPRLRCGRSVLSTSVLKIN